MLRFVAWTLVCCAAAAATGTPGRPGDGMGGLNGADDRLKPAARLGGAEAGREKAVEELADAVVADPEAFKAVLAFRRAAAAMNAVGDGRLGVAFKKKADAERIQKAEEALRKFDEAFKPKERGPDVEASAREIDTGK